MENLENPLEFDNIGQISNQIQNFIKSETKNLSKNGVVIGLSGGIDSSITTTLSVKSIGPENVFGLILPERESNPQSEILAKELATDLGIKTKTINLTQILEAFDVYKNREDVVRKYLPTFNERCKYRIAVSSDAILKGGLRIPFLEIQDNENKIHKFRLNPLDYSTLWSATSIKHRTRMIMLYFFGEQNNLAIVGSTNKSENIQGYFVKYGDGGVDIEPILNLYKTQVYQLGTHLKIPESILKRKASPDTWSFEVSDEDFFYGVNYRTLDLVWYAKENNIPLNKIEKLIKLSKPQIESLILYLEKRWKSTSHMRKMPSSIEF